MFLIKLFKGLKFYIVNCLITPMLISLGVVLVVCLLFYSRLSFFNTAINRLIAYQPSDTVDLINQSNTAIISSTAHEVDIIYPEYGKKFAEISIESIGMINISVFNSDDYTQLNYGWGRSFFSRYPGEGGKIVLAGHLYKYRMLYNIKIGDEIVLKTAYGIFRYKVKATKIINEKDPSVMEPDDTKEQLYMYVCYPMYQIGKSTERFVVISELSSGPMVKNIPFK
jgi:LPXTG-site transpeptidase (sortase) family protein